MQIESSERGGCLVVSLREPRFDHLIATAFRDEVLRLAGTGGRPVVLDLAEVQFMDSSGLGALVGLRKRLGWGVRIVLAGLRSPVYRVFEIARMTEVFTFYTSAEAATAMGGTAGYTMSRRHAR
jgi:anti-sigma B factor antagonist